MWLSFSSVALVGMVVASTPTLVSAHDAPAAFMDVRDPAASSALENLRSIAAEGRRTGLFPAATDHTSADCEKCKLSAATVFGLLRDDPSLVGDVVDGMLCKPHNNTTPADVVSTSSSSVEKLCKDVVKDIVAELSKLAIKALNGGWYLPQILCNDILHKCTVDCCETLDAPEQIHLSLPATDAGSNGIMAVSWATLQATSSSVVEWWPLNNASAISTAFGSNFTYTHGGWIGVLHTATMTNLHPATTYAYRVGSSDSSWSAEFNFTTFPADIGTPSRPLRAIQIADIGCGDHAKPTINAITQRVERGEVDIVLHPGDIGYDDGDEHIWDVYMRTMQPIASRVPYMVAPGNHECLWNFSAYKRRFPALPTANPDEQGNFDDVAMFYELRVGPFSLFMLDSESVIDTAEITPAQSAWFSDAAMSASMAGRPILTMTHRPLYCSSGTSNCDTMAKTVRAGIEETLNRAGVLLHTTGHLHEYERTLPISQDGKTAQVFASNSSYINPRAPTYIVNGAAGNPAGQNSFQAIQPWSVSHTLDVGYNVWTLSAAAANVTLSSTFVNSVTGAVVDSFTITRN